MSKTRAGNFLEDFSAGQEIRHATPRTVTEGDAALYLALTGSRFAQSCSAPFAIANGLPALPLDDLLVFHIVFGKSVPDLSLNAVANLGYANCTFLSLVWPGDTLQATSTVLGMKENSNRRAGIVWVRTTGRKASGEAVLDFVRWVMVRKRDPDADIAEAAPPSLPEFVRPEHLVTPRARSPRSIRRCPARRGSSRTTRSASASIMSTAWA